MNTERYAILFSSVTGNTRKLAETIRQVLPEENCDYFGMVEGEIPSSITLYIGFWIDRGMAPGSGHPWAIGFCKQRR